MKSHQRTPFESLDVVRLGRSEWRVASSAEPSELLGFIERQRSGRFEIVWMSDPMRWAYADSFESSLVAFGDSVRFTGEILPQRALDLETAQASRRTPRAVVGTHRSTWVKPGGHSSVA